METLKIENLKKGEFITIGKGKKIYETNGYCRMNKKYEVSDVEDISNFRYLKKGTNVTIADY